MAPIPGWQDLIICGLDPKQPGVNTLYTHPCHIGDFIQLIKNGITDLVLFSTLVVVFMCVIAGLNLLKSQGNSSALTAAKDMMWKVLMGYVWILAAWVIVYFITSALIKADFNFFLDKSAAPATQPFTLQ